MTEIFAHPEGCSHEEGLLHSDPQTSCLARMAVSSFANNMAKFLNDEMQRGTDPVVLLSSLMRFQVQTHACLATQLLKAPGHPKVVELYEHTLKTEYLEHADRIRRSARFYGAPI
ncbi:hypothetical protein G6M86_06565 [Agrobacterium tumefaciens]|uniref:Uncharacterized protein n=1 Tax=Agrobacterium tumefaciens TaxID=358 RepID=A0AAJ4N0E3_AGRTU|nr:hypothetical protein G6M86_06565 [Agrobacterium tumefaciens]